MASIVWPHVGEIWHQVKSDFVTRIVDVDFIERIVTIAWRERTRRIRLSDFADIATWKQVRDRDGKATGYEPPRADDRVATDSSRDDRYDIATNSWPSRHRYNRDRRKAERHSFPR